MEHLSFQLGGIMSTAVTGSVVRTEGAATAVAGFPAPIGSLVEIERQSGLPVMGEVVGFREELTLVCPRGDMSGVRYGNRVRLSRTSRYVRVGDQLLGRVINAQGEPIDGGPAPMLTGRSQVHRSAPPVLQRPRIDHQICTGVRAIDGLLPCGLGQRIAVFSGAGVGKSVLLGMLARHTQADVKVIALIGERGREVQEFIQHNLGPDGLRQSVIVVATSDEPALLRLEAALTATAIAEYFRDQGRHVLLAMDSLTRFAMAQREVGLAAGESPAARGYPASVFSALPRLLERAGRGELGSITGFYTVLVEGDDISEPISDATRSLLDGHIILSRKLADGGHYPAIDVLGSISRLATQLVDAEHMAAVSRIRALLATYAENEDLISIGAYRSGTNPRVDQAIAMREPIRQFLQQHADESCSADDARHRLLALVRQIPG